jgi:ABC-2 type transport system permease protein
MKGVAIDGLAAAERILLRLRHDPSGIVLTLSAPLVLVLAFGYIIGSAIIVPGGNYREYLLPGLFAITAVNVIPALVTMARDAERGVVDRFRSMPISRSAIPLGQAVANTVYGAATFVLMGACGLLVGWRAHRGLGPTLAALGLLLAVQFAAVWVGMFLGLVLGSEAAAGQASIIPLPLAMVSNLLVPTAGMPTWLRVIAEWNPVSAVGEAIRRLCGNPGAHSADAWPLTHPVAASLLWTALILVVFVPLTTLRYARPR